MSLEMCEKRFDDLERLVNDLCLRINELNELAEKNRGRLDLIDGNGKPLAEGGFIGRMAKQHKQNQRLLWSILAALLFSIIGNYIEKVMK